MVPPSSVCDREETRSFGLSMKHERVPIEQKSLGFGLCRGRFFLSSRYLLGRVAYFLAQACYQGNRRGTDILGSLMNVTLRCAFQMKMASSTVSIARDR